MGIGKSHEHEHYKCTMLKGDVIKTKKGNFVVEKQLGYGRTGLTYLGEKEKTGQPVTIKCIENFDLDPKARNEIAILKHLGKTPHFSQYITQVQKGDILFIISSYIEGQSFTDLKEEREGSKFILDNFKYILSNLLIGLNTLHAMDIMHNDLHGGNIIIQPDGTPVIIDFGISCVYIPDLIKKGAKGCELRKSILFKQDILKLGNQLKDFANKYPKDSLERKVIKKMTDKKDFTDTYDLYKILNS